MDPSGMVWGSYEGWNGNKPEKVVGEEIVESEAVRICVQRGAKLPSIRDYFRLTSYFETEKNDQLFFTEAGRSELLYLFPDMLDNTYWSSSITEESFYFFYEYGIVDCYVNHCREAKAAVRCIHR